MFTARINLKESDEAMLRNFSRLCDMSMHITVEAPSILAPSNRTRAAVEVELAIRPKLQATRPPMFKVVMLNDDYTPMDFVVGILVEVFRKSNAEATRIMMDIHNKGAGICGVYTRDVAETKADAAISRAQSEGYPLQCLVEPEGQDAAHH